MPGVRNLSRKYMLPHPIRVRLHRRLCLPHQLPLLQGPYDRAIAPLVPQGGSQKSKVKSQKYYGIGLLVA
ncbi:hypothetical protein [Nostoc sp.]|uniref:hypothetical protein n=1 Tax=Nostoc sp. TaxID=1180 RepID=UPI002FF7232A